MQTAQKKVINFEEKRFTGFLPLLYRERKSCLPLQWYGSGIPATTENLPLGITSQLGYGFLEHFY
jgi:hypothetical protein